METSKPHPLVDLYFIALGKFLIEFDERYLIPFQGYLRDRSQPGQLHIFDTDPDRLTERHHTGELVIADLHAVLSEEEA